MSGLIDSFSTVVSIVIAFVGVLGVLYFVYGAFQLMMSGGNAQKAETGKQAMVQALIGVSLVLVAFTVINTITSLVGGSGGAVQVGQVAGRDSASLEAPSVVSVVATGFGTSTGTLTVTFSEPVYVSGTVAVSVKNRGVIKCASPSACPTDRSNASNVLTMDNAADGNKLTLAAGDVVEKFALGRGATIRDVDDNPALYAFQPVIAQ